MRKDSEELARLSDFEWSSGCRYIMYVSSMAGLAEVSSDAIYCLKVGSKGVKKCRKEKKKTMAVLSHNLVLIYAFVARHTVEIGSLEKGVIRSLCTSIEEARVVVSSQLNSLDVIEAMRQGAMTFEGDQDEIPF